eukprot:1160087-Pelagomonas_calceolata.AAC.10
MVLIKQNIPMGLDLKLVEAGAPEDAEDIALDLIEGGNARSVLRGSQLIRALRVNLAAEMLTPYPRKRKEKEKSTQATGHVH